LIEISCVNFFSLFCDFLNQAEVRCPTANFVLLASGATGEIPSPIHVQLAISVPASIQPTATLTPVPSPAGPTPTGTPQVCERDEAAEFFCKLQINSQFNSQARNQTSSVSLAPLATGAMMLALPTTTALHAPWGITAWEVSLFLCCGTQVQFKY